MSIKRKLTLTIIGISLAAVALTVTTITSYLIYDLSNEKRKELSMTASLTADRNGAALMFMDVERVQNNLEIFRLRPAMLVACVYDAGGQFFAGYQAGNTPCPATANAITTPGNHMMTALEPVRSGEDVIGSIYLASDMREIDAYVQKILQISGTVAGVVLLLTMLLALYFQRIISGPILELASTVQAITKARDYSLTAKVVATNEIGVLAGAFNDMLEEVLTRDRELVQANETLEEKVTARTQQLEEEKHKAEEANKTKSEFLRNMSHEFRTPLHALISYSAYGIKEYETAERSALKQYFEIIGRGSERLSRMVNQVLDLARLEHGHENTLLEKGDLCELTERAVELMSPLVKDKELTLSVEHGVTPAPVACDHDKIVQVITNLLGNAVKFTPRGKAITLRTEKVVLNSTTQIMLTVIDEGIGIPEDETEMIFESFRQSSRTNTGAGGTGLGLAICRGIITANGGKIWAENNRSGTGARVSFVLPLLAETTTIKTNDTRGNTHENAA